MSYSLSPATTRVASRRIDAHWTKAWPRLAQPEDLETKMRVFFRQTTGYSLASALSHIIDDLFCTANGIKATTPERYYVAVHEALDAGLEEGHRLFVSLMSAEDSTRVQIRACELWNNFAYTIDVIAQSIMLPMGSCAESGVAPVIAIELSRDIAGITIHGQCDDEGCPDQFLKEYLVLRETGDHHGNPGEYEPTNRHIAQIFRLSEQNFDRRIKRITGVLKKTMMTERVVD